MKVSQDGLSAVSGRAAMRAVFAPGRGFLRRFAAFEGQVPACDAVN